MTKISNQYSLTNVLFADAVNGRVGIGTTSPGKPLEVYGPTLNTAQLKLFGASSTNGKSLYLGGYGNGSYITSGGTFSNGWVADIATTAICSIQFDSQNAESNIAFYTTTTNNTGPNERMRIAGNGNVGIGTTSPIYKLAVLPTPGASAFDGINVTTGSADVVGLYRTGSSYSYGMVGANQSWIYSSFGDLNILTDGSSTNIKFGTSGGAERMRITSAGRLQVAGGQIFGGTSTSDYGSLTLYGGFGVSTNLGSRIEIRGYEDGASTQGAILSYTNNTERMRILANGNVLIGNTTDSGDRLRVTGSIASNGTSAGMFFQNRAAGNFLGFYADNTSTFLIYNTNVGNIATINQSNGNYTALSDVNKKKDFEQSNIGLNEVLQLKPTLYRMKTDDESSAKELGFIAQEVKEFIPQAYSESGEGEDKFIGLNQMPLIAALTKAIQEQQTQINELKALLNA